MVERKVVVVTDAGADLPSKNVLETRFGVGPIIQIPLFVDFGKGDENHYIVGESDGIYRSLDNQTFKSRINKEEENKTGVLPKTAAPSEEYFDRAYKEPIEQGLDIVSIHVSKKLSATFESATKASEKIGGNRVSIFDTQTVSMAQGLMVIRAEKMAADGATKDEILEMLDDMRVRTNLRGVTPNIKYLQNSGRISNITGMFGKLMHVVPILDIDHIFEEKEGKKEVKIVATVMVIRKQYREVKWMEEFLKKDMIPEEIAIVDFDARESSDKLKSNLIEKRVLLEEKIYQGDLGPITGSHGGPRTWAMAVVRK